MTGRTRLTVIVALSALSACTSTSPPQAGALLNEPTAVAVFRGVTIKSGFDPTALTSAGIAPYPYRPYIAVANAGSNDLNIFDGVDDSMVLAPAPVRGLVYPVPGRPTFLVAADLGDGKPDLLAVVTAGDLPTKGGSQLQVIRTWAADGGLAAAAAAPATPFPVELGGDVVALVALPSPSPGTAQLVAALAGGRIAVITFTRPQPLDPAVVDIDPSLATVVTSAPLGFQPVDLAVVPLDPGHVYAATIDPLPGAIQGVAEIDITGVPAFSRALNAHAPTRLVAAARLAESDELRDLSSPVASAWDQTAFAGRPAVARIYAVLDESGCGLQAAIACGVVAIDPVAGDLLPDPTPVTDPMHAPFLAPIPIVGAQALATSAPPQRPPPDDPTSLYAGTYLRIAVDLGLRQTTFAAGVASTDGALTFIDLGRWDVPSEQSVHVNVTAKVTSTRPPGTPGTQWIVLQGAGGGTVPHLDAVGLTTSVGVTPGYTPTDAWGVVREGILPNLQARRAEPGYDGGPSIALQQTGADGSVAAAVRLYDPTLGVHVGDTVVLEPTGLGTCGTFEATITELVAPTPAHPGGYVRLGHRTFAPGSPTVAPATVAAWNGCVDRISAAGPAGSGPFFAATFRAAAYVVLRGTGTAAVHVGRPDLPFPFVPGVPGTPFTVAWQDEGPLAAACTLPPAKTWTDSTFPCDPGSACRDACEALLRARLARRISYVPEAPATLTGPALRFTLAVEQEAQTVARDMALSIVTSDGKVPMREGVSVGAPVDARAVVPFDRSPWFGFAGIRFLVPFAGGVVLDGTPTLPLVGGPNTIH